MDGPFLLGYLTLFLKVLLENLRKIFHISSMYDTVGIFLGQFKENLEHYRDVCSCLPTRLGYNYTLNVKYKKLFVFLKYIIRGQAWNFKLGFSKIFGT